ncbi:MAG: ATP-dependent helicase, partial [Actinomycetota bacterium]|nr:ATP-dependent helicase [Actinomycetota bacterium]
DIAARGIHVDDVALVVHVDPPTEHKAYLHRSGRTARAGAGGTVVTIATIEQAAEVRTLTRQAGIFPTTVPVRPGAAEILALTGPPAAHVEPAPFVAMPAQRRSSGSGRPAAAAGAGRGAGKSGVTGKSDRAGKAGAGRSGGNAPARTRAELAARAGQAPVRNTGRGRAR